MRCALLGLLAACGDPSFCPGFDHVDGTGCVAETRAIAIDGDPADWEALPPPTGCDACKPGDVARVHGARTDADRLAILVEVKGAVQADPGHSYRISFAPASGPPYDLSLRVRSGAAVELALTSVPITGLPIAQGLGSVIEIAMPTAALPFAGGCVVTAGLETLSGGRWVAELASTRFAIVCWDPTSPVCAAQ